MNTFRIGIVAVLLLLIGCTMSEEQKNEKKAEAPQDYGAHSTMNSIDYFGEYVLQEPSEYAPMLIHLEEYGKARITDASGVARDARYQWDVTGSVITVEDQGTATRFFVGERYLKNVNGDDKEGQFYRKRE